MGCKDIGIRKSEFVPKTQFLSTKPFPATFLYRNNSGDLWLYSCIPCSDTCLCLFRGGDYSLTSPTNQNSSLRTSVIRPSFILPSSKILSSFIDNYVSLVFSFIKSNSLLTTSSQEKGSLCFILTNNHQGGSEPTNQRQRITCGGWLWRHSKIREREN